MIHHLDAKNHANSIEKSYWYQKRKIQQEWHDRQEREKLKHEIETEIMNKISIILEDEAVKKLCALLNQLGN